MPELSCLISSYDGSPRNLIKSGQTVRRLGCLIRASPISARELLAEVQLSFSFAMVNSRILTGQKVGMMRLYKTERAASQTETERGRGRERELNLLVLPVQQDLLAASLLDTLHDPAHLLGDFVVAAREFDHLSLGFLELALGRQFRERAHHRLSLFGVRLDPVREPEADAVVWTDVGKKGSALLGKVFYSPQKSARE